MPKCKFCDAPFQWGHDGVKWLPLVPIGDDEGMDRTHQDGDGNLRALHNVICARAPSVTVTKLPAPIPAHALCEAAQEDVRPKRRGRKGRGNEGDFRDGAFPEAY